jgi:UDP-N-acetylmuramate dehydrogenase
MLSQIISSAQRRGLSGLEFLTGIPGTVGGALAMNAGIEKASIGNLVEEVTVMDYNNRIKNLSKEDIKFGYRKSSLSKFIILNAHLRLIAKEKREIINRIKRHINYRLKTQDISKPCAGCIFKNPKGVSAGRLIDLCGLKGVKIGGAYISRRHGNFILNLGTATLADVLGLMDLAKKRVKKKFNINLEPEIIIWQ